ISYGSSLAGVNVPALVSTLPTAATVATVTDGSAPTPAQVQANLNTISAAAGLSGNFTVSGSAPTYVVTFNGVMTGQDAFDIVSSAPGVVKTATLFTGTG